jgi:tetratricopeptide (TPR) repeat protein
MAMHPDMLEQARRFHQAGKLAEAERAYQQLLQANGQDPEVWYQLADTVLGQGRLSEAAERFRQALQLQPDHVAARAGLGVTLASLRKLPEAVAELRAARLRPSARPGTPNLREEFIRREEQRMALEAFEHLRRSIRRFLSYDTRTTLPTQKLDQECIVLQMRPECYANGRNKC